MEPRPLNGAEIVLRRIPSGADWFSPPDKITGNNFTLRDDETGVSVYRACIISASKMVASPDALPGSIIACATVEAIMGLKNGLGKPLNLYVVAVDDETDPGHAEIRGPELGTMAKGARKWLAELFKPVT